MHWEDEGFGDLIIEQRGNGFWLEDSAYDAPIAGPYKSREGAMAARDREVARRIEAIAIERAAST